MFRIGEFSWIATVPLTALRFSADAGLLPPVRADPGTGYRYYDAAQLPRLNRIPAREEPGCGLEQIRSILDEAPSPAELRAMLTFKRAEIDQRIAEDRNRLARVEARFRLIDKEGAMPTEEIVVKHVDPVHGLAMREVISGTSGIPPFLTDAFAAIGMNGIEPAGPPLTIYHDSDFDPAAIDTEVVIPVAGSVHGPLPTPAGRELADRTLEACEVAALVHVGPYDTIGDAYQAMAAWVEAHGFEPAGPPREIYLTGPDEPGPPVTEIRMPVRRD